jgi:uncharacterized protein
MDEAKRHINLAKHGIDFEDARTLFESRPSITLSSHRGEEERFATTGEIDGLVYTTIWTKRGEASD